MEPTHSLTQVSGNWVIRAAETYSSVLSRAPWSALNHVPPPASALFIKHFYTRHKSVHKTHLPHPKNLARRRQQLICFYACECEWELLSALYLLIVMICANAVKCHLTFVNFGLASQASWLWFDLPTLKLMMMMMMICRWARKCFIVSVFLTLPPPHRYFSAVQPPTPN